MNDGIDFSYLESISGGDKEFELSMIRSVTEEIDQKIECAKGGVFSHNPEQIRLQTHSLKNLFAIIGMERLQTEFRLLESGCDSMANEFMQTKILSCEKEWQLKKLALDKIVANYETVLAK